MYMQAAIRHGKDLGQSRLLSSGAKKLDTKSGGEVAPLEAGLLCKGSFMATHAAPSGGESGAEGTATGGNAVFAGSERSALHFSLCIARGREGCDCWDLASERVSQRERRFVQVALGGSVLHGLLQRLDGLQQPCGCGAARRED